MTDPERISKRSRGLAAQLLQAGAEEQPAEASVQQTLAALGVSAAVLTTTSAASAVAGTAKVSSVLGTGVSAGAGGAGLGVSAAGGAAKAVSATLLVKWIGIGVVSGVGLAGMAAVATEPAASPAPSLTVASLRAPEQAQALRRQAPAQAAPASTAPSDAELPPVPAAPPLPAPATSVAPLVHADEQVAAVPALEVGAPLAAEVAYVDRARALLVAGRAEQGLALLRSYEREFPEARLLPEVLFLQLETCDRLGRGSEARLAAQRLLEGFPKSPHASRARKLLFQ
jgi:hypothetical protein